MEDSNAVVIQCHFVTGSNALGCMVVLVSESNATFLLKRSTPCRVEYLNETNLISSFYNVIVYGYDIESDDSIGTLAVPGQLTVSTNGTSTCLPTGSYIIL